MSSGLLALSIGAAGLHAQVGIPGPSYAGAYSNPTGSKPQSKLWWNDGHWWGWLWSAAGQSFGIHRLDTATQTWVDTSTAADERPRSHADCLWDGTKLYVATHRYALSEGNSGHALELYRYGYDPVADRYELDVGFPALIGDASTETLLVEKDSTGTVWAVWVNDLRVWFAHTRGNDLSWTNPVVHPLSTTDLATDDICSAVRFQGNRIGVAWSDQVRGTFFFTHHLDGASDTSWSPLETVPDGVGLADDHLCLKASVDGRVFAALRTHADEVVLAVRGAAGAWSSTLVASASDRWTQPILLLDEQHRNVFVLGRRGFGGGTIYLKASSLDSPVFPQTGPGLPVLQNDASPDFNDVTGTKQSLSGTTGLVIVASHDASERYWHNFDDLGGSSPVPPVAAFTADPRSGFAPLQVQFTDTSAGPATSWSWSFGDGTTSTAQHPVHSFGNPGSYTVTLQAASALGSDAETRTALVQVSTPPSSITLVPVADAYVREATPRDTYGSLDVLRVRHAPLTGDYRSYLKFFVPPTPSPIISATLRLYCNEGSDDGGAVHLVASGWSEPTISWSNAPGLSGPSLALGSVAGATWVELDVSPAVTSGGTVSFGLGSASDDSAYYSSRQGANPPQLVLGLRTGPPGPPVADFEADPPAGLAPLTVQFRDTSSGPVVSWLWTFGDGTTSTVQNPSHVFAQPGVYSVSLRVTNASGSNTRVEPYTVRALHATPR